MRRPAPNRARNLMALLAAALLAGCATLGGGGSGPLVSPATAQNIGKHYAVTAPIAYSRFRAQQIGAQLWTVNGPLLDALYLYEGLKPGATLLGAPPDAKLPRVKAGMAAHEVAELLADTLRRTGATQVETPGLAPARFGTLAGFRFDLSYVAQDGLEYQGLALGATRGEELLLLYFTAPRPHYFASGAPAARQVFGSVTLR